jgi:hypothetical protein
VRCIAHAKGAALLALAAVKRLLLRSVNIAVLSSSAAISRNKVSRSRQTRHKQNKSEVRQNMVSPEGLFGL